MIKTEVKAGAMMENKVVTCPHVFVVDNGAKYLDVCTEKNQSWKRANHKFLLPLVGLALLGLLVEGYFIYKLYQKTEDKNIMSQRGSKDLNQSPTVQMNRRPFAHLLGSHQPVGKDNVVHWVKEGDAVTQHMKYDRGRLVVEVQGYYYVYSKVQLNAADECLLIQHRVMKNTSAYDDPIELMKSKSFHCWTHKNPKAKTSEMEELWNNFLGGIFNLQPGDRIFVTLDSKEDVLQQQGLTENFMGAFMVFP